MNLLCAAPINPDLLTVPSFGGTLAGHIHPRALPAVRAASCSAWTLLSRMLKENGYDEAPVRFLEQGKPVFASLPLYFSISHCAHSVAVLLSDAPCGVDIEEFREETARLIASRCLTENERRSGLPFFTIWTHKEALGKMAGTGLVLSTDITAEAHRNWLDRDLTDLGAPCHLAAVSECADPYCFELTRI